MKQGPPGAAGALASPQGGSTWRHSAARCGALSIGVQWLTPLIAAACACVELRELFPKESDVPRDNTLARILVRRG